MNGTKGPGGGRFEDRLLSELKQLVASRASSGELAEPAAVRRAAVRPRLALAGGVAALGLTGSCPRSSAVRTRRSRSPRTMTAPSR
jgi:hypothetical protein